MRIQAFEFEDLEWFPAPVKDGMGDFLRYILKAFNFYSCISPIILEGLHKTNEKNIIDLAAGGGGNIEQVYKELRNSGSNAKIILTDKYPNTPAYKYIKDKTGAGIDFIPSPVDAANVPEGLRGFRTMFSAFHHFQPSAAKAVLDDAVKKKAGIAIFDGGDKNLLLILGIIIFQPILYLLFTPFFRPFKFSRLFFTYIIPLIPLCTVWDGVVSILRLYTPDELMKLAQGIAPNNYIWKAGRVKSKKGMHVTYLIGYPATCE